MLFKITAYLDFLRIDRCKDFIVKKNLEGQCSHFHGVVLRYLLASCCDAISQGCAGSAFLFPHNS